MSTFGTTHLRIPSSVRSFLHSLIARAGTILYRNPSRSLFVIGVTGTKGKSTTVELIRAILTEAGYKTAAASTIHFCIAEEEEPNMFKMTMPGRMLLQKFLRRAVDARCTHAVIEMTSEGALQSRHIGIELDALVFTNLAPEHLERHGGMDAYADAKLSFARHLSRSPKRPRFVIANADDAWGEKFLEADAEVRAPFSLLQAAPYAADDRGCRFTWHGQLITSSLPGLFNLQNIIAAMTLGSAMAIPTEMLKRAVEKLGSVAGRAERIVCGQDFSVVVDYAHTPESLEALLKTYYRPAPHITDSLPAKKQQLICVTGAAGGGRDIQKRPRLGAVAERYCDAVILTNEDPYDEDPRAIVQDVAKGFSAQKPRLILDRRAAIRAALKAAHAGDTVIIAGKGTDPFIMGPHKSAEVWSDKRVIEEELQKLLKPKTHRRARAKQNT